MPINATIGMRTIARFTWRRWYSLGSILRGGRSVCREVKSTIKSRRESSICISFPRGTISALPTCDAPCVLLAEQIHAVFSIPIDNPWIVFFYLFGKLVGRYFEERLLFSSRVTPALFASGVSFFFGGSPPPQEEEYGGDTE